MHLSSKKKKKTHNASIKLEGKNRNRQQNGGCQEPGKGMETCGLMGTQFQFCKMKKFWRWGAQRCGHT